ncbi:hypothetical protein L7F22_006509 [Adiantum nelumboides]|nr:hypothetical protein [Adiantum nelumboides]
MMKKDRFLAGLKENLRWRVELKKPRTYADTLEVARNKEWKIKRLTQLGVSSLPGVLEMKQANFVQSHGQEEVHHTHVIPVVAPVVPPIVTPIQDNGLRQDMRQVVDLMKNLSLNLLSNARNHHGQGRQFNQTNNSGGQNSGGGKRWKNVPTCYNCGELGHISPQCDKPKRMGGDMYPLPTQLPNRSSDYGIEIKVDEAGPSRFTTEEKGKAKVLNVVKLEKTSVLEDSLVMPIGKRTTEEKEGRSGAGPSKKKGKVYEGEDVKVKRKRRARRKFHVTDFPLGEGQESYSLREDLTSRKADVTFGQLVEMVPKLKRQWKKLVNPIEREQDRGSVRVLAVDELPDICHIVNVWHKRKNLGQRYVDGGAQICVITQTCVEKMGFAVAGVSGFRIRMANHQKVKCLGMVKAEWVSPVVVTPKKDGRWRVCVDFKPLNAATKKDPYPLPFIDQILDSVAGHERYNVCDGYSGYFQLKIAVEDQRKITFITPWGCFCYTMLPFGLTNGPVYYQKRANWALSPFIDSFVKVLIDDFCVYSTRAEHCEKLEMVLKCYDECGGMLNPKKCSFAQPRVKLLGHMFPDKVKAMVLLPTPKDSKQVATFVHKVKYMARFIRLISQVLYTLQQAAKQDPLVWNEECEAVFQNVKEIFGGLPAIQAPDWEQVFYVNPSVGEDAIGAMLLQKGKKNKYMRPVYCASRVKVAAERKLSELELEFEFSFLVEESTRATLADLLTYKESPLLIKEEVIKKVEEDVKELNNVHILFSDGSYRKSHDAASGVIALYDPEGKLVCKKGFKLDVHSNNEAEYATLEAGLHICLKHGVKRLCIRGDALLVVKQFVEEIKDLARQLSSPPGRKSLRAWFLNGTLLKGLAKAKITNPTRSFKELVERALKIERKGIKENKGGKCLKVASLSLSNSSSESSSEEEAAKKTQDLRHELKLLKKKIGELTGVRAKMPAKGKRWCVNCREAGHTTSECVKCDYYKKRGHLWEECPVKTSAPAVRLAIPVQNPVRQEPVPDRAYRYKGNYRWPPTGEEVDMLEIPEGGSLCQGLSRKSSASTGKT